MLFAKGLLFGGILETVQGYLTTWIDVAMAFFNGLGNIWYQVAILGGLALFAIIGIFVFIKKFFKVFLVLGILGGIGYFLYTKGILQELWAGVMGGFINLF
jgi:hypothetical protein